MATGGDKPLPLDDDVDMADLASLDAPSASSSAAAGAPSTRFRPRAKGKPMPKQKAEPPKPVPEAEPPKPVPEDEPKSELDLEPETEATPALQAEHDRVDAMEVEGMEDAVDLGNGEEEDLLVREIDVYFTPKPFGDDAKLYVMQYPLRPCWRPYELNDICEEVRVKPLISKVEIDLNVNTQSENYDQEAPLRLTKQTLSSSKAADVADYAVGVLKRDSVHLNHIDAVLQLRPSMSHVVSGQAHTKHALQPQEKKGAASGSMAASLKGNECPEGADYAEDSEKWISLAYQPTGSNVATKYLDKMISNEGGPIDFTMSTSDYLTSLCPGASTNTQQINKSQAIRDMLSLPLQDRLKKWFTEVSEVTRFNVLKHLAPTYSEEEILKVLPEYADLVRGLWVCKSSLLFDDRYSSKRDRVLLEFTKRESIPSNILNSWNISMDPMWKRILVPLGKSRAIMKDFKFKFTADLAFLKRYPHVVHEQECAWSAREITICKSFEMSSRVTRQTRNPTRSNVPSDGPHPNMNNDRDGPAQGIESHVQTVMGTVFTGSKVRSMQAVVRDLRQMAVKYASNRKDGSKLNALSSAAKSCASLSHEELVHTIGLVAVSVHGVYVARHDSKNSLRNVLIDLFSSKQPDAILTKQEILDSAAKNLKREVTEREYHQVVTEICNSTEDGHLVLKNGDEP